MGWRRQEDVRVNEGGTGLNGGSARGAGKGQGERGKVMKSHTLTKDNTSSSLPSLTFS